MHLNFHAPHRTGLHVNRRNRLPHVRKISGAHFITPTELRRSFISSQRQHSKPLVFAPPSESEPLHTNMFVHFVRRSAAHGAWMKPHMVRPELMAPTSRSTLKERMKTRSTSRGRCGSHVMWPRTHPFPAPRICSCTPRAWRSSRQAKPWSMSHLGMPSRLCCNRRDARSKATKGR